MYTYVHVEQSTLTPEEVTVADGYWSKAKGWKHDTDNRQTDK